MLAVRKGDAGAFEQLVHRHIDALYNYAFRLSRSGPTAEDLVQEALLAVWQKAHTYKPSRVKVSTWLHKILHNKFIDFARKDRLEYNNTLADKLEDPSSPERSAGASEAFDHLLDQIALLPPNQQAALWLSHAQGFSNPEIAVTMGQSVRAVESLLARARRSLKDSRHE